MRDLERLLRNAWDACKTAVNICISDARKYKRETLDRCQSERNKKSPVAVPAFRMRDKFHRKRVINSEDRKSQ